MKRQFFGTDGIRTRVPGSFLDAAFTYRLGRAIGQYLQQHERRPYTYLLARDTRTSGEDLLNGLQQGLQAEGVQTHNFGILPTPCLSALIRDHGASGGSMITASHNPASDNGVKLFRYGGEKWQDEQEIVLEQLLANIPQETPALEYFPIEAHPQLLSIYKGLQKQTLPNWKIVIDAANGAASSIAPELFRQLGIQTEWCFLSPDGSNINHHCGSEHPAALQQEVLRQKADFGFAFDGDGDRLVVVNSRGEVVPGDHLIGIFAHALTTDKQPGIALTEQSNFGVESYLLRHGHPVWRTPIGDRYVWKEMNQRNLLFGGENSGHFLYSPHLPCSDGIGFALILLQFLAQSQRSLEDWQSEIPLLPSKLKNIALTSKPDLESIEGFQELIRDTRTQIGKRGRILIRYSGTEAKIRLLVEMEKETDIQSVLQILESGVARYLPVAEPA
jgi:phosphoglucosamine mutase